MTKFKLTFDKDWEQDWLNELCQEGWAMSGFALGFYRFVPCRPGEYIYQVDLLPGTGLRPGDPSGYAEFMTETGVEVVDRWFRWVFLRKKASDGPFQIYTDIDSQIEMYRRIRQMFLWVLVIELCASVSIWVNLLFNREVFNLFFRCMAAIVVLIVIGILRTIRRCSRRIRELEREK